MTKQDLLKKYYGRACHNLLCYSANYLMDRPKDGFEKEWEEAKAEVELLEEIMIRETTIEKIMAELGVKQAQPEFRVLIKCSNVINQKELEKLLLLGLQKQLTEKKLCLY